jgi:hypothetical protein
MSNPYGLFYIGAAIFALVLVVLALPTMIKGPNDKDNK